MAWLLMQSVRSKRERRRLGVTDQGQSEKTRLSPDLKLSFGRLTGSRQHLSSHMLTVMRQIARSQGFRHLIAPIRFSLKSRYPYDSNGAHSLHNPIPR